MNIKNFDPYDFSKKEIDGVPIYYKNLPWAPCIHIRIVFNTGAFDDPVGKEGLSHFLEHMLLKGCPSMPSKKAVREWSRVNALNTLNAFTSFDNVWYTVKCLPEKYETVLMGLKDMIFNSYLKSEDFEAERKVITQEAWNRFQNEKYLKYRKEFVQNLYQGHEHSRTSSPLGWPDTISKISREDIVSWHKDNYGIGNFYIVIAGAVEEKHIDSLVGFLKDLPRADKTVKEIGVVGKPVQKRFMKNADEIGEVKEQVEISLFRVDGKRSFTETGVNGMSNKLVQDLLIERLRTEHALCYGVSVGFSMDKTFSQAFVNVKTDEKNVALVEKEFKNVADEIIGGKHTDRFNTIKKMYLDQIRATENISGEVADSTIREISKYDGHIITLEEQIDMVEKVTYEDIVEFIKWAFDPEYIFTEIILPSKK